MKYFRISFWTFFWISVSAHLILMASFILYFASTVVYSTKKMEAVDTISSSSYVTWVKTVAIKPAYQAKQAEVPRHARMTAGLGGQQEQKLLTLLHAAIAAKQSYPDNAVALQQTGTASIRFLLYPDGHLARIALLKSSGAASLDEAALAAVQASSPIHAIQAYLPKAKYFTIDVIFE